jgi:hypothetical protein
MTRHESYPQAVHEGSRSDGRRVAWLKARLGHAVCSLSVAVAGGAVLAITFAPGLGGRQSAAPAEAAALRQISLGLGGQLEEAQGFAQGLAAVKISERWGYIDRTGRMILAPQYQAAQGFSENLAAVKVGERWGYIDRTGRMVLAPQYEDAQPFVHDLAAVKVGERWGYIDRTGRMILAPQYDHASPFWDTPNPVQMDGQWLYIDRTGQSVITP